MSFFFFFPLHSFLPPISFRPSHTVILSAAGHILPRFGPYFTEPVIAGLDKNNKPYICAMDLLGAPLLTDDFVLAGTCSENLYGMCESLYRPNMVRFRGAAFAFALANLLLLPPPSSNSHLRMRVYHVHILL